MLNSPGNFGRDSTSRGPEGDKLHLEDFEVRSLVGSAFEVQQLIRLFPEDRRYGSVLKNCGRAVRTGRWDASWMYLFGLSSLFVSGWRGYPAYN